MPDAANTAANAAADNATDAPRLCTRITTPQQLAPELIAQLYALMTRCYAQIDHAQFTADLAAKDKVLLLEDADGHAQGFTTLAHERLVHNGQRIAVIFSGDTVIAPDHWGSPALPLGWCHLAGQIKAAHPDEPLYWLLICKGHRTYRYLPLFTHDHAPRHDRPTPPETATLIDHLAHRRFGKHWQPATGLVQFPTPRGQLKPDLAALRAGQADDPHIAYFLSRNPGYMHGDELVCLTELSAENMRGMARRRFLAGFASGREVAI